MRADIALRFSSYLTLALATLCLATVDEAFLPGMVWFAAPMLALIALAFCVEGRWSLSPWLSNLAGFAIAAGSAGWIALNILQPSYHWFDYAPYPVALLPYGAPLVMVLLLAKLFRSDTRRDFWILQALGLVEVALACILANDASFGPWLLLYLASGLWAVHGHARLPAGEERKSASAPRSLPVALVRHCRPAIFGRGVAWGATIATFALVFFLITPRFRADSWSLLGAPSGSRLETGYTPRIDLNFTGAIRTNDSIAFEVYVEDANGGPILGLSPHQRWRGSTLNSYMNGRWMGRHLDLPPAGQPSTTAFILTGPSAELPDLGPDRFYLSFRVDLAATRGLFLADPAPFSTDPWCPPVRSRETWWVPEFHGRDGTFLFPKRPPPQRYRYQQVTRPYEEDAPRPAIALSQPYLHRLLEQPLPRVRAWTEEVLHRLVGAGRLTAEDAASSSKPPIQQEKQARVARALCDFLARSGDFHYRLEMRRKDYSVDAIEDFLCNVHEGFCEHFATGLALMLRCVGIPARVVNGFRGAESLGPEHPGWYVVRHSQAHAWVEALLTRQAPSGQPEYYWQMLDPTPGDAADTANTAGFAHWLQNGLASYDEFWRDQIVGYSPERQKIALTQWWDRIAAVKSLTVTVNGRALHGLFVFGGLVTIITVVALLAWRWYVTRMRRHCASLPTGNVAFYNRFLKTVARHTGSRPESTQTPREFGAAVSKTLRDTSTTARLADVPEIVIRAYYEVRFGGVVPEPVELDRIDEGLRELESAWADAR